MGGGRIPALTAARQRLDFTGLSGFPPYGGDYSIIATCRSTGVCGVWGFAFQCAACFAFLLMFCAGVCGLPMCGHGRGNGARPREMADSRVLATARHIHICLRVAVLRDSSHFRGFRSAGGGEASRAWHLWSSSARCSGARPHSRSLRRRSRRLRGDTRRNASLPGYRLLALRRVSPRIRRTASAHVAQFGTRPLVPCLTFHKARFSSQHLRSPTFVGSLSSWGPAEPL